MPAAKSPAKTFSAVLERMDDRLRWVIARIPFDAAKIWGKRGQIRIQGDINGFAFSGTLFPTGNGGHFLLVNKKMQKGGKTAAGLSAKFRLQPDTAPRQVVPPKELLRELGQSKRLLKFYESMNHSTRNWTAKWASDAKSSAARTRRAQQIALHFMETMEAERELPPMIAIALRQNPRARERWEQLSPSRRRGYLLAVFYYRTPESRARRLAKCMKELLGKKDSGEDAEV
ncbi:MAG TPA: YdeI/OmpD-associated family protein [Candidatus Angelobacter sp.]|nr:YdeI/OmpD-associated family protein [Candidatus Angelobacter sp.]